MGLIIVAGGQYGSEGKGKVASYMANKFDAEAVVRIGGTNSGHTVVVDGEEYKLRMLPTAAITTSCQIIFPAGSYIDLDILQKEIDENNIDKSRIHIDTNAVIMLNEDSYQEREAKLNESISSTCSGTGAAVKRRIERTNAYVIAKYQGLVKDYLCDTKEKIASMCDTDKCVVVEGTQGYMLSLLHTPYYPYCTSRDTSAAGILSEVGGSIRNVDKVVDVFRAYPIRVAGSSGPLPYECTWADVTVEAKYPRHIKEYTTVTNKVRRVAKFDFEAAAMVVHNEKPDIIVMNHLDYIDGVGQDGSLITGTQIDFISMVEKYMDRNIDLLGMNPTDLCEKGAVYTEVFNL